MKASFHFFGVLNAFALLLFCQACQWLPALTVRSPYPESEAEMKESLHKLGIDSHFAYRIRSSYLDSLNHLPYVLNTYKVERGGKASVVQVRMYEAGGSLLAGWEQCFGGMQHFGILDSFPMKRPSYLPINEHLTLAQDLQLFPLSPEEEDALIAKAKASEYVVMVLWAGWGGWYSKSTLRRVQAYLETHGSDRILFLQLNISPEK